MKLILGDCLEKLKELPDNSVDACITDPPYGMSFMGKNWDKVLPPQEIWREVMRVLKPGAWLMAMCIPRQDCLSRMIISIGDAGFDTDFTSIYWTYASGFPKALNIGKAIDKKFGGDRRIIMRNHNSREKCTKNNTLYESGTVGKTAYITEPATEKAREFEGAYGGFQPKPAVEIIIVAMKPMIQPTFVGQALDNGKGITWLDDCRIPHNSENFEALEKLKTQGRFSANLIISDDVLDDGKKYKSGAWCGYDEDTKFIKPGDKEDYTQWQNVSESPFGYSRFFSLDAWAEKNLPFLIVPKASKREKNSGCEKNNHLTVKPIKLMSYLITMTTRPGDVVLDPFMGSGTTGCAAVLLDREFIGIEMEADYIEIAKARIEYWSGKVEKQNDLFKSDKGENG